MDRERVVERLAYIERVAKASVTNETVNFKVGQSVGCHMIQGIINKTDKTPDDEVLKSTLKGVVSIMDDIRRFLK